MTFQSKQITRFRVNWLLEAIGPRIEGIIPGIRTEFALKVRLRRPIRSRVALRKTVNRLSRFKEEGRAEERRFAIPLHRTYGCCSPRFRSFTAVDGTKKDSLRAWLGMLARSQSKSLQDRIIDLPFPSSNRDKLSCM